MDVFSLVLFVVFLFPGFLVNSADLCDTPCDDPCEVEGSEISLDLVGKSGQVKIFKEDADRFIKLKLDKIEERDTDKGHKVKFINNLASIDAEWCDLELTGEGDDESVNALLLAHDDGLGVDIRVTVDVDNSVTKSRCCVFDGDLCVAPFVEVGEGEDATTEPRDLTDCSGISDDDCLLEEGTDCGSCHPTAGDDDGDVEFEDETFSCDAERVDIDNSAFKWSIDLMGWECNAQEETTINFGWDIMSNTGGDDDDGDDGDDDGDDGDDDDDGDDGDDDDDDECEGCGSGDGCGESDEAPCCEDVDEVTCDFHGGSLSLPTTAVSGDDTESKVLEISFDGHGQHFGVTVKVPCSDHIEYDPIMTYEGDKHDSATSKVLIFGVILSIAVALWN